VPKDEPSLPVRRNKTRKSNPQLESCNQCDSLQLQLGDSPGAAPEHRASVTCGHCLASTGSLISSLPPSVSRIADAWPALPPHIREAISTLVDAAAPTPQVRTSVRSSDPLSTDGRSRSDLEGLARQMAKECHHVVQGCLREEGWKNADEEFFGIIATGLRLPNLPEAALG